jgi:hypothetical protein
MRNLIPAPSGNVPFTWAWVLVQNFIPLGQPLLGEREIRENNTEKTKGCTRTWLGQISKNRWIKMREVAVLRVSLCLRLRQELDSNYSLHSHLLIYLTCVCRYVSIFILILSSFTVANKTIHKIFPHLMMMKPVKEETIL